jgi:hypothetical protein
MSQKPFIWRRGPGRHEHQLQELHCGKTPHGMSPIPNRSTNFPATSADVELSNGFSSTIRFNPEQSPEVEANIESMSETRNGGPAPPR